MENKLISMLDFVLEQSKIGMEVQSISHQHSNRAHRFEKIVKYANFLKKELNIGMFVPAKKVNGVWVVSEEPNVLDHRYSGINVNDFDSDLKEYQEAKENVLFEGFIVYENSGNIVVTNGRNSILFSIRNFVKHIDSGKRIFNIECVSSFDLTLTQSAKQKLGI